MTQADPGCVLFDLRMFLENAEQWNFWCDTYFLDSGVKASHARNEAGIAWAEARERLLSVMHNAEAWGIPISPLAAVYRKTDKPDVHAKFDTRSIESTLVLIRTEADRRHAIEIEMELPPSARRCPVEIQVTEKCAIVMGVHKPLKGKAYLLVDALVRAYPGRLKLEVLKQTDESAHKTLSRLRDRDADWAAVLAMSGTNGSGYGIVWPENAHLVPT